MITRVFVLCVLVISLLLTGCTTYISETVPLEALTLSQLSASQISDNAYPNENLDKRVLAEDEQENRMNNSEDEPESRMNNIEDDYGNRIECSAEEYSYNREISNNQERENLDSWIGGYEFEEAAITDEIRLSTPAWAYLLWIYYEHNAYHAKISIDGYMTLKRFLAIVEGDENEIRIVLNDYYPKDDYCYYNEGSILLSLKRHDNDIWDNENADEALFSIGINWYNTGVMK